jgi:hypothetical protein
MWITASDIAAFLEIPEEPRMADAAAAIAAQVERIHPTLDYIAGVPADIKLGAVMWAASIVQQRTAPQGFPQYGEPGLDMYAAAMQGSRWAEIQRLLRLRKPVAV